MSNLKAKVKAQAEEIARLEKRNKEALESMEDQIENKVMLHVIAIGRVMTIDTTKILKERGYTDADIDEAIEEIEG